VVSAVIGAAATPMFFECATPASATLSNQISYCTARSDRQISTNLLTSFL